MALTLQRAHVVYQLAFPSFPIFSVALHMTSESRPFDQIPGPLALKHFSSETWFHLFLDPRAIDSSCSLSFLPHHCFHFLIFDTPYICKDTLKLLIDGAHRKVEKSPASRKLAGKILHLLYRL